MCLSYEQKRYFDFFGTLSDCIHAMPILHGMRIPRPYLAPTEDTAPSRSLFQEGGFLLEEAGRSLACLLRKLTRASVITHWTKQSRQRRTVRSPSPLSTKSKARRRLTASTIIPGWILCHSNRARMHALSMDSVQLWEVINESCSFENILLCLFFQTATSGFKKQGRAP